MNKIFYIDRATQTQKEEPVICKGGLQFLYLSQLGMKIEVLLSRYHLFSRISGWFHKTAWSRKKIAPFIKKHRIDASEFVKSIQDFSSFNDFFTRSLRANARPIDSNEFTCVAPADGAYLVFPNVSKATTFSVKFKNFSLKTFLQSSDLANFYDQGSMVIVRLAPFDYHRFHFPVDCTPSVSQCVNGDLHSVHPIALKNNFTIFCENKRILSLLHSSKFGTVAAIEIGAFNVGSIKQTYHPGKKYLKGDEKGFFEVGGSTIVLLFEAKKILFDKDLIKASESGLETRCCMGQSIGKACIE